MLAVIITNVTCFTSLMQVKEVPIFHKCALYRVNNFETILKFKIISSDIQASFVSKWRLDASANAAAAAAASLQSCPTLCDPIDVWKPTRLPRPWDSPGKNTGVGCHFLLQYMKVKSESEVAQSCPTLRDPMDCSLPGSSVHGIFQARVLEWGTIAFSKC